MKQGHTKIEFRRIELTLGNCREELRDIPTLADSLRKNGLIQDMTVRHIKISGTSKPHVLWDGRKVFDRYELVAGNRRHAAISLIRETDPTAFDEVSVKLFYGTPEDAFFAQLAENVERANLAPMDLANAIKRLVDLGNTQREIAERMSRTQAWVSRLYAVRTKCTADVHRAIRAGQVSLDVAGDLATLDDAGQAAALATYLEAGAAPETKREARAGVKRAANRVVRVGLRDLRAAIDAADVSRSSKAAVVAQTLRWALGEGELPIRVAK